MNIADYIKDLICEKTGISDYDDDGLNKGIHEYTEDNGFEMLQDIYNDEIIENVIRTNIKSHFSMSDKDLICYFTNYRLIETIRLINNKSLQIAKLYQDNKSDDLVSSAKALEEELNLLLDQVYKQDRLRKMLQPMISEIILNIDSVCKNTNQYGIRMIQKAGA